MLIITEQTIKSILRMSLGFNFYSYASKIQTFEGFEIIFMLAHTAISIWQLMLISNISPY